MSDDVDDLLRRALVTLDDQVPPAYFDTLAARTLARLDEAPAAAADPPRRRGRLVAVLGLTVAAAAGAMLIVSTRAARDAAQTTMPTMRVGAAEPAPVPAPAPPPAAEPPPPAAEPAPRDPIASRTQVSPKPARTADRGSDVGALDAPALRATKGKAPANKPASGGKRGDDVTKRAALAQAGDALASGLDAVAGRVRACAGGTPGTANVRLTIAPSGEVGDVVVSGRFAGTPVAACVERAVKTATFPPSRGGPRRVDHSYLLPD